MSKENKIKDDTLLYETRSEEVQEILGKMPSWIVRWGITVIALVVIALFVLANFLHYPDKVFSQVYFTSNNLPKKVTSRHTVTVDSLFAVHNQWVDSNEVIIKFKSTADYSNIIELKELIQRSYNQFLKNEINLISEPPFELGEVKYDYFTLIRALDKYHFHLDNDLNPRELKILKSEIGKGKKNQPEDLRLKTSIASIVSENNKRSQLLRDEVDKAFLQVLETIKLWEGKYILRSPISGKVNLFYVWRAGQKVLKNQTVIIIVPPVQEIFAKGSLAIVNSAKVKDGQHILIELPSHPQNEYGYLEGKIKNLTSVPMDSAYAFDIELNQPFISTTKMEISIQPPAAGTGFILANDKSLLDRLLENY